jgi:uncharacterized protein YndB with AHSA1/START domain
MEDTVWTALTKPDQVAAWLVTFEDELVAGGSITLGSANTGDVMRRTVIAAELSAHICLHVEQRGCERVRCTLGAVAFKRRLSFGAHPYDSGS